MGPRRRPPYAAYLRVYEPLAAFAEPERSRLASLGERLPVGDRAALRAALDAEHAAALHRVTFTPLDVVPHEETAEAYVLRTPRGLLVCPRQDRLRSWMALTEFKGDLPDHLIDHFVPPAVVGRVDSEYAAWRAVHPEVVPRILTSTWHVPARWFVLVTFEERELRLGDGDRSLVFHASMADARRRAARGLRAMRSAYGSGDVVDTLEETARWLEEFHPHSVVELDYGGLVDLIDDAALEADDSPRDVAFALRALAEGDTDRATDAFRRLAARWEVVQALEHAS